MKKKINKKIQLLISILLISVFLLTGCQEILDEVLGEAGASQTSEAESYEDEEEYASEETSDQEEKRSIDEDGTYTSKDEVAAYLNEYGHLPDNFITKK